MNRKIAFVVGGFLSAAWLPSGPSEVYAQTGESQEPLLTWRAGGEATLLKPFLGDSTALRVREGDGISREDFRTLDFESSLSAGYRVFLGAESKYGIGLRGSYWSMEPELNSVATRPPANGFGEVTHPRFGSIDIGSTVPADRISASADLKSSVANMEWTYGQSLDVWRWGIGAGVEYGSLRQGYRARLVNDLSGDVGSIDYSRVFHGTGPTVQFDATAEILPRWDLFGALRSSLLFGASDSTLRGGEDLDLTPSLITTDNHGRDDALTRFEGRVGSRIHLFRSDRATGSGTIALEGQNWVGAGSPTSEQGNLGLFGVAVGGELRF